MVAPPGVTCSEVDTARTKFLCTRYVGSLMVNSSKDRLSTVTALNRCEVSPAKRKLSSKLRLLNSVPPVVR